MATQLSGCRGLTRRLNGCCGIDPRKRNCQPSLADEKAAALDLLHQKLVAQGPQQTGTDRAAAGGVRGCGREVGAWGAIGTGSRRGGDPKSTGGALTSGQRMNSVATWNSRRTKRPAKDNGLSGRQLAVRRSGPWSGSRSFRLARRIAVEDRRPERRSAVGEVGGQSGVPRLGTDGTGCQLASRSALGKRFLFTILGVAARLFFVSYMASRQEYLTSQERSVASGQSAAGPVRHPPRGLRSPLATRRSPDSRLRRPPSARRCQPAATAWRSPTASAARPGGGRPARSGHEHRGRDPPSGQALVIPRPALSVAAPRSRPPGARPAGSAQASRSGCQAAPTGLGRDPVRHAGRAAGRLRQADGIALHLTLGSAPPRLRPHLTHSRLGSAPILIQSNRIRT